MIYVKTPDGKEWFYFKSFLGMMRVSREFKEYWLTPWNYFIK